MLATPHGALSGASTFSYLNASHESLFDSMPISFSSWMMWPFEVIWNKTFCILLLLLCILFSWCAARLVVFCLAALADISLLHDYVCTYYTAGPRARCLYYIFYIFSFLFFSFFFFFLAVVTKLFARFAAASLCVPGSKTCAVWACQHALLFSSLLSHPP